VRALVYPNKPFCPCLGTDGLRLAAGLVADTLNIEVAVLDMDVGGVEEEDIVEIKATWIACVGRCRLMR